MLANSDVRVLISEIEDKFLSSACAASIFLPCEKALAVFLNKGVKIKN